MTRSHSGWTSQHLAPQAHLFFRFVLLPLIAKEKISCVFHSALKLGVGAFYSALKIVQVVRFGKLVQKIARV